MTSENQALSTLASQAACGLVGLATAAFTKLDKTVALGILDKVQSGRAALSFGVRIDGETCEIVAYVMEGTDAMHLLTLSIPTPAFEPLH